MSVKIRLTRVGRKNSPYFRVAIADSRRARDGRIVEAIGHYQPLQPNDNLMVDEARALYWLNQGAQPSDTVRSLLKRMGIMRKFHESKYGPSVKPGHEQYHVKKERPEGKKGKKKAAPAPETAPAAQAAPATESAAPATESAAAAPESASAPAAETPAPETPVAEAPVAEAPAAPAPETPAAPAPEAPAAQ